MIKKLILISIFCYFLFACGKKSDPNYQGNNLEIPSAID